MRLILLLLISTLISGKTWLQSINHKRLKNGDQKLVYDYYIDNKFKAYVTYLEYNEYPNTTVPVIDYVNIFNVSYFDHFPEWRYGKLFKKDSKYTACALDHQYCYTSP